VATVSERAAAPLPAPALLTAHWEPDSNRAGVERFYRADPSGKGLEIAGREAG